MDVSMFDIERDNQSIIDDLYNFGKKYMNGYDKAIKDFNERKTIDSEILSNVYAKMADLFVAIMDSYHNLLGINEIKRKIDGYKQQIEGCKQFQISGYVHRAIDKMLKDIEQAKNMIERGCVYEDTHV